MSKKYTYHIPMGEYSTQFIIALAMAIHCKVVEPAELQYWFSTDVTQKDMTVNMYNRVKTVRGA